jgi:hypothetical protein
VIRSLVEQHLPTAWLSTSASDEDDADISRDYILQVLEDEDSYDDPHELAETLQSLLGDVADAHQSVQALVDALLESLRGDTSRSTLESPLALTAEPRLPVSSSLGHHLEQTLREVKKEQDDPMAYQREALASKQRQRKRGTESRSTEAASTPKSSTSVANAKKGLMLEDDASAWQACREQGVA